MGYETKLIIGVDTGMEMVSKNNAIYFQVMATIDMCKIGHPDEYGLDAENKTPDKKRWFFWPPVYPGKWEDDSDFEVYEDCYGMIPKPIPIKDVLKAFKKAAEDDDYRRYPWAVALLESMADDSEGLSVLWYGY